MPGRGFVANFLMFFHSTLSPWVVKKNIYILVVEPYSWTTRRPWKTSSQIPGIRCIPSKIVCSLINRLNKIPFQKVQVIYLLAHQLFSSTVMSPRVFNFPRTPNFLRFSPKGLHSIFIVFVNACFSFLSPDERWVMMMAGYVLTRVPIATDKLGSS